MSDLVTDDDVNFPWGKPRDEYVDDAADDDFRRRVRVGAMRQNLGILGALFPKPDADLVSLDEQVNEIERQFRTFSIGKR